MGVNCEMVIGGNRTANRARARGRARVYRCIEVRERFGGLEFYMNDATPEMAKLVRVAVAESFLSL